MYVRGARHRQGSAVRARRRAMTFVEMVLALLLMGVALFLLIGWMHQMREEAKQELARRMLLDLDRALAKYYRATGRFPPSSSIEPAMAVTAQLLNFDRSRPLLEGLQACLWDGSGRRRLVDPWGTPLRYIPETSDSPFVPGNLGRPLFVSAGPDRSFGEDDAAHIGDNLRSDDPGPDGFAVHWTALEFPTTQEAGGGKKVD